MTILLTSKICPSLRLLIFDNSYTLCLFLNIIYFFSSFDGHAGSLASQYCCDWISSYLTSDPSFPHDMCSAMKNSFAALDEDFLSTGSSDGTTACVCVVLGGQRILCANAGDSRAIVVRKNGASLPLSKDHKPSCPEETKRITNLGGKVIYSGCGSWRLEGMLSVSRGIGDAALKKFITPDPDVYDYMLSPEDYFVVIASDGLWDVVDNDQVAKMTISYSCNRTHKGGIETDLQNLRWTARKLCEHAQ